MAKLSETQLFGFLCHGDLSNVIRSVSDEQLRLILPLLVRVGLCPSPHLFSRTATSSTDVRAFLLGCSRVNWILRLLKVDFSILQATLKKDVQIRKKNQTSDPKLTAGRLIRFEKTIDPSEKFQLLFADLMGFESSTICPRKCELIDNLAYFDDVGDMLCIAIAEIAEILVKYRNGPIFIRKLLLNFPDQISSVVSSLIRNTSHVEESNSYRLSMLAEICSLNPLIAFEAADFSASLMKLPELFVFVSAEYLTLEEFLAVLSGVFFANDNAKKAWLIQYLNSSHKKYFFNKNLCPFSHMKKKLFEGLRHLIFVRNNECSGLMNDILSSSAANFIRLICFLKVFVNNFKFTDEENEAILDLMCSWVHPSSITGEFVKLSIATLVACPNLAINGEADIKVSGWLKWLLSKESEFESCRGVNGGNFAELLLLIVIHLLSNQTQPLTQLISSELNIKIFTLKANPLTHVKNLLTAELFTEEVVAERAARVPVTKGLNSSQTGYLPVHCVQQLLKNKIFSKHRININDWIFKQILSCGVPVHSAIPALLDSFSASCVMPATVTVGKIVSQPVHLPLEENELLGVFSGNMFDESKITARVLFFYYALVYDENLTLKHGPGALLSKPHGYSKDLWDAIPVRFLSDLVQTCIEDYAPVASNLLRIATSKFPYLFTVMTAWPHLYVPLREKPKKNIGFSISDFKRALELSKIEPGTAISYLESLVNSPFQEKIEFLESLASSLPHLLEETMSRKLLNATLKLWLQLETLHPRRLYKLTLSSLVRPTLISASVNMSKEEVDPLLVLRCNEKVFKCGPILEITLRILTSYLVESKMHLQHLCTVHSAEASEAEKEELMRALVGAQESAAVQILLEACLPATSQESTLEQVMCAKEIECIVFNYVHQAFISDPSLIKLVHFQGYPCRLLPLTVAGIPSMHCCLDFIPEMLRQPDHSKQIFAINLLSHLCVQYPISKAFSCAKLTVDFLNTLLCAMTFEDSSKYFAQVLSACSLISQVFPPLTTDICSILLQFGRMVWSAISVQGHSFADLKEHIRSSSTSMLIPTSITSNVLLLEKLTNMFGEEFSQSVIAQSHLCQNAAMSLS